MDTLAQVFCGLAGLAGLIAGVSTYVMQSRLRKVVPPALPNVLLAVGLVQLVLPIGGFAMLELGTEGWRAGAFAISLLSISMSVFLLRQGPRLAREVRERAEGGE